MSGFIVATTAFTAMPGRLERASRAFLAKGMSQSAETPGQGLVLRLFANQSHDPAAATAHGVDSRFCTYVGTLIYRGHTGRDACEALLGDLFSVGVSCLENALGNYCVLFGDRTGVSIVTDPAGLHHVYMDEGSGLLTNSFVSAASSSTNCTVREQEALEYILLGATFGARTIVDHVTLVDPRVRIRVSNSRIEQLAMTDPWRSKQHWQDLTLNARLVQAQGVADNYYRQVASAFGKNVTAALSGGYDSRLNLALLLRNGVQPKLFVYGAASDPDVRIAQEICRGEGLPLDHIDRARGAAMEPDEYWRNQEGVFHGLDGLTQYGFACEPFEVSHRHERVAGRLIAINGGGGEIWRDYWKLPDRPMSATEFVLAYFSGRFTGLSSDACSESEFLGNVAAKVTDVLGVDSAKLTSAEVQSLYSRLRLRFWQGKNNSVDNHIGFAVTPFSELSFAVPAMWIPVSAKRDGWFERQLICGFSRRLARYRSSHGYALDTGPGTLEKAKALITRHLPRSVRARRRRAAIRRGRWYFQSERFVTSRFGAGPLEVRRFVTVSQLADALSFSRALTVERMLRGEWL